MYTVTLLTNSPSPWDPSATNVGEHACGSHTNTTSVVLKQYKPAHQVCVYTYIACVRLFFKRACATIKMGLGLSLRLSPFMPNVFSHPYQLDVSISNFEFFCFFLFFFYSIFERNFYKQTVENLIRRRVLRRLIWFCTVCRCPTKRTLGLYVLVHTLIFYT